MGFWALVISTILYFIVSIDLCIKKNYPLALVFSCYAIANIAYIWMAYYKGGES